MPFRAPRRRLVFTERSEPRQTCTYQFTVHGVNDVSKRRNATDMQAAAGMQFDINFSVALAVLSTVYLQNRSHRFRIDVVWSLHSNCAVYFHKKYHAITNKSTTE